MDKRLQKYAQLAIRKGVNLQEGQILIINTSVNAVDMTRLCVEEAYLAGAKEVVVFYQDDYITKSRFLYEDEETLCKVRDWIIDSKMDYLKEGACFLQIISNIPGILKDVDPSKISKQQLALASAGKETNQYMTMNKTQWCIVSIANKEWADIVFPGFTGSKCVADELMDRIYSAVHVEAGNDPIQEWTNLNQNFAQRVKILNDYNLKALHFINELGTDITIALVDHHIWVGGSEHTINGIEFNPNIPTEEIFTMPKKTGVNGKVFASKPLNFNGTLIEEFYFEFKDGKVIDFDAKHGKEALAQLVHFDEGSCYLGEVALVPYDSAISNSGILFYNTLFDENASCHLALGNAYPMNVQEGVDMSEDGLQAAGANHSMTHIDFMFGTYDLNITGICQDGTNVAIFKNGNFVF